jgi:hypothetical protein
VLVGEVLGAILNNVAEGETVALELVAELASVDSEPLAEWHLLAVAVMEAVPTLVCKIDAVVLAERAREAVRKGDSLLRADDVEYCVGDEVPEVIRLVRLLVEAQAVLDAERFTDAVKEALPLKDAEEEREKWAPVRLGLDVEDTVRSAEEERLGLVEAVDVLGGLLVGVSERVPVALPVNRCEVDVVEDDVREMRGVCDAEEDAVAETQGTDEAVVIVEGLTRAVLVPWDDAETDRGELQVENVEKLIVGETVPVEIDVAEARPEGVVSPVAMLDSVDRGLTNAEADVEKVCTPEAIDVLESEGLPVPHVLELLEGTDVEKEDAEVVMLAYDDAWGERESVADPQADAETMLLNVTSEVAVLGQDTVGRGERDGTAVDDAYMVMEEVNVLRLVEVTLPQRVGLEVDDTLVDNDFRYEAVSRGEKLKDPLCDEAGETDPEELFEDDPLPVTDNDFNGVLVRVGIAERLSVEEAQ